GQELNDNYLRLAGLHREDVYVTNTVKCRPGQNKTPTEKEAFTCGACHLPGEVAECEPEVIILAGGTACSLIPKLQLDVEHGIPQFVESTDWAIPVDYTGVVVPMYHPALGLHDTGRMFAMLHDWEQLKRYFEDYWLGEEDSYSNCFYQLETGAAVGRYLGNPARFRDVYNVAGVDTEHVDGKPYSVQISLSPGSAVMVLANDYRGIEDVVAWVNELPRDWQIALHNAPQDMDTLERMGITVPMWCLRDTMQEAFHLGLPQSLKVLGYRHCGVRMQQYEDLVVPHSKAALMAWMEQAIIYAGENLQDTTYKQLKTKVKEIVKPCKLERDLKRIYKHTQKGGEYKSWVKLAELEDVKRELDDVVDYLGGYPKPGLIHVPLQEQVRYACRDADVTLRVAVKLQEMRAAMEEIAEGDND
ncbi:MAG TPA: uracil-DNA glycosylase family protein, partial [Nitrospiraceae bacterium]